MSEAEECRSKEEKKTVRSLLPKIIKFVVSVQQQYDYCFSNANICYLFNLLTTKSFFLDKCHKKKQTLIGEKKKKLNFAFIFTQQIFKLKSKMQKKITTATTTKTTKQVAVLYDFKLIMCH